MALELQNRYSKLVDAKLRYSIVQKDGVIWNNKYEGDPKAGAVKIPVRDTETTVVSYNRQNGAEKSYTAGGYIDLVLDKDKAVNEVIDGYEADAVPDNIVADRIDSAGYSMALQINEDGTAELLDKATVKGQTAVLSKDNAYDRFVDIGTAMTKAKVPANDRWALVSPDAMNKVRKSPEFIAASALGDEVKQTGAVGMISGFTVFEDATLPDNVNFICGHKDWCCRVREWKKEVHLQDLNGSGSYIGASAVQGRMIYGHKVTKSAAVVMDSNILNPSVAIASNKATVTLGTNATGAKYRVTHDGTVGSWTEYSAAVTLASGDKIEVYGIDAKGVRSGIVDATNS